MGNHMADVADTRMDGLRTLMIRLRGRDMEFVCVGYAVMVLGILGMVFCWINLLIVTLKSQRKLKDRSKAQKGREE